MDTRRICDFINSLNLKGLEGYFNKFGERERYDACYRVLDENGLVIKLNWGTYYYTYSPIRIISSMKNTELSLEFYKIFEKNGFYLKYTIIEQVVRTIIFYDNSPLIQYLLEKNAINTQNIFKEDLFWEICIKGYVDLLNFYIKNGYINSIDEHERDQILATACIESIKYNKSDCFDILLAQNIKITNNIWKYAICNNNLYFMQKLMYCPYDYPDIEMYCIINDWNILINGNLLMYSIAYSGYAKNFKFLLDNIPVLDINYKVVIKGEKYISCLGIAVKYISCLSIAVHKKKLDFLDILLQDPRLEIDVSTYEIMHEDPDMVVLINKYGIRPNV